MKRTNKEQRLRPARPSTEREKVTERKEKRGGREYEAKRWRKRQHTHPQRKRERGGGERGYQINY